LTVQIAGIQFFAVNEYKDQWQLPNARPPTLENMEDVIAARGIGFGHLRQEEPTNQVTRSLFETLMTDPQREQYPEYHRRIIC
jgi:hypothetical protein